jgi:glycosyltransferase 2 family protein
MVMRRSRRLLPWIVKLLISIGLMAILVEKISVSDAFEHAKAVSAASLFAAFSLICAQGILSAVRWHFVIEAIGARLSVWRATLITFVSLFFSQFLPASLGADLVRIWQSRRAGLPLPVAVTSVTLERFGNLLCVLIMVLATLPVLTLHLNGAAVGRWFIVLALVGAVGLVLLMVLDRFPQRWYRWRLVDFLGAFARDTRSLFLRPRYAGLLLLTAVLGQIALASSVSFLASGLELKLRFIDCLVAIPPVALVSSLPISVGGWGVREVAMVTAFGMFDVPAESALALSIVLGLTGTAASLPGGVIALWFRYGPDSKVS